MSLQACSCSDMSLTPGKSHVARGISGRNAARYTRISRCLGHVATHARCSDIPYLRGNMQWQLAHSFELLAAIRSPQRCALALNLTILLRYFT